LQGPLKEELTRLWLRELFNGLYYLHSNQVVHRDLKPDNFLLDDRRIPIITDFGFAIHDKSGGAMVAAAAAAATNQGFLERFFKPAPASPAEHRVLCDSVCGTAEYIAPEVHSLPPHSQYDAKPADMYAMGVSAFEMLNFTKPFVRMGDEPAYQIGDATLVAAQKSADFNFNRRVQLSKDCIALLRSLMEPSARARPTASTVRSNRWLK
jgi:mitogen-activated protein kinase kinase kinase